MAIVNEEYERHFLEAVKDSLEGRVPMIPNGMSRLQESFNSMQSRMTLLGSVSGSGKTSFIDHTFVLLPYFVAKKMEGVHTECIYYSLERKKKFKHAKWTAWMLYKQYGLLISSDAILGYNPKYKLTKGMNEAIQKCVAPMSELLDDVHIYDGRTTVERIRKRVLLTAKELGTAYVSDLIGVKVWGVGAYISYFSDDVYRTTRKGNKVYLVPFTHKGVEYTIEKDKTEYILDNPKTFVSIVVDGIGLIQGTEGQSTKQAVDDLVNLLADIRDIYGFSPVLISQFNRAISDIQRFKAHGTDLSPQESDFKDSGNAYQAADLVLALFDPIKFKSYDKNGFYFGYDVVNRMCSVDGPNRFRSLHILKNSFGVDNRAYGLGFWGECSYFEVLPRPSEEALFNVYDRIQNETILG